MYAYVCVELCIKKEVATSRHDEVGGGDRAVWGLEEVRVSLFDVL